MKTNNLKYQETRKKGKLLIEISIRLNDECNNGHEDFSITGTIYEGTKTDRNMITAGAIGDEIAKYYPEFEIFERLHLSDFSGAPMYAVENGYYYLKDKACAMDYLRISENEYNQLKDLDKLNFVYSLYYLGIVSRWESEAKKAIKLLESLTGLEFESKATKKNINPPKSEEISLIAEKKTTGYYNPEQIKERKETADKAKQDKIIADLTASRDKEIKKANDEFNVKMFVLNNGLPLDNCIYYNHLNKLSFNWLSYHSFITPEQLEGLKLVYLNNYAELDLPDNMIIEFYKNK